MKKQKSSPNPMFKSATPITRGVENTGKWKSYVAAAIATCCLFGAIGAIAVFLGPSDETSNSAGALGQNDNNGNGGGIEPEPGTPYPTFTVTPHPTNYPTPSPVTPAPTPPTIATNAPTRGPTASPTKAPLAGCTGDEECGCNQIRSRKADWLFLMDQSGSVGETNFDLAREGIKQVVSQNISDDDFGENGTRIGIIGWNHKEQTALDFTEFETKSDFINDLDSKWGYSGGWTNQAYILNWILQDYLQRPANEAREGSQLIIIMITDGNPCTPKAWGPQASQSFIYCCCQSGQSCSSTAGYSPYCKRSGGPRFWDECSFGNSLLAGHDGFNARYEYGLNNNGNTVYKKIGCMDYLDPTFSSEMDPVPPLKNLRQSFNFSFAVVPVEPDQDDSAPWNLNLFANAVTNDETGLSSEEYQIILAENATTGELTEPVKFGDLGDYLINDLNVPLGPCVPEPSGGRRRLQEAEVSDSRAIYLSPFD